MYGLPRQPLTAGFCEALASRHLILCFSLLTFLLNPGKAGAVAFVYSALRWAFARAIIPACRLACRQSFAGSRHAARKPCSPAKQGQTFKRSRRSALLSAWSCRGPTRWHEVEACNIRRFAAVKRCDVTWHCGWVDGHQAAFASRRLTCSGSKRVP